MIEIRGVTKRYGALTALDNLSLTIGPGEVFGFIGPNGAGKSTTMKILAGLLQPDSGTATVCGHSVATEAPAIRRVLGYMPDFLGVYDDLTVDEYLQFFASAFRIERGRRRAVVSSVLELTDLTDKRHAMVDSLSRGMQQRLGVARVLIHEPKVLLLDEPASGLDPRARIELRELLLELKRMGKCIMVSSHILTELAEMSTSIGIIEKGRLLFAGSIADAFARAGAGERIAVALEPGSADGAAAAERLRADARVAGVTLEPPGPDGAPGGLIVELTPGVHGHHFLIESLMAGGARIASFTPRPIKLEDAFLRLTKGQLN
ncbi:MAG: ABC transporter ATP-binding protein [Phycisphaeraceae bacterium]|nr:ABC transporter ATP-binding protein [Phycisphaeraceae bacterium]